MDQKELDARDPNFKADLKASEEWVDRTKRYFQAMGFHTYDFPEIHYPNGKETDHHDMGVVNPVRAGEWGWVTPYEVKHRPKLCFKTFDEVSKCYQDREVGDFPLLIVDRLDHFTHVLRTRNSWAPEYWIWNSDGTAVLKVDVNQTVHSWVCRHCNVPQYGDRPMDFLMVPLYRTLAGEYLHFKQDVLRWKMDNYDMMPPRTPGLTFNTAGHLRHQIKEHLEMAEELLSTVENCLWVEGDRLVGKPG
jgi:hypothetical protein